MIQECNRHWQYQDTANGLIMPWYTLPTLQWLEKQDVKNWEVFEYGAGYSTIWWRLSCECIDSVDHNSGWAKAMGARHSSEKQDYIDGYLFGRYFDCIIVDGEWRDECVSYSRDYVKSGGYMIVDNYDQEDFPSSEVIDSLLSGWEKTVFAQPNHTSWKTAIFRKP